MSSATILLDQYNAQREELIKSDRALRRDHQVADLSTVEVEADQIIRKIRAAEANSIWNLDYPSIPHPFPGMEFLTGPYKRQCQQENTGLTDGNLQGGRS